MNAHGMMRNDSPFGRIKTRRALCLSSIRYDGLKTAEHRFYSIRTSCPIRRGTQVVESTDFAGTVADYIGFIK